MSLPPIPNENDDPWFEKRNNFDLAVKEELEGRLAQETLDAKYAALDSVINDATDTANEANLAAKQAYNASQNAVDVADLADLAAKGAIKASVTDPGHQQGRLWLQLDASNNAIGLKISDGGIWKSYALMAEQVLVPSSVGPISIANGAIKAPHMAVGVGDTGQRVEITGTGLRVYDGDGTPTISMGTAGDDVISVTKKNSENEPVTVASIDSDGRGTFSSLELLDDIQFPSAPLMGNVGDLRYNGQFLDTPHMLRPPRGIIFRGLLGTDSGNALDITTNALQQALGIGQVTLDEGRLYTASIDVPVLAAWTAGTAGSQTSVGSQLALQVWIGTSAQNVATPNGQTFSWPLLEPMMPNGTRYPVAFPESIPFTGSGTVNVLVRLSNYTSSRTYRVFGYGSSLPEPSLVIRDIGPAVEAFDGGSIKSRATTGSVTPPQSNVVKTTDYGCTWSALWGPSGTIRPASGSLYDDGRMMQGGLTGSRAGQVGFGPLGLSGKTITGMWVRLQNRHTQSSAGSRVRLGVHGVSSMPSGSAPNLSGLWDVHFTKGGGMWVPIPQTHWAGFAAGTHRGIQMGGPNVNVTGDYYIFDGLSSSNAATSSSLPPVLRVSYKG